MTTGTSRQALPTAAETHESIPPSSWSRTKELRRKLGNRSSWYLYAFALIGFVMLPIGLYFGRAFENGGAAISDLVKFPGLLEIFLTTIFLAAASTIIAAVLAVVLGTLVMKVPRRLRGVASFIPQLPLVIPPVAMIYGWIFLFAPTSGYGNTLLRSTPFFNHLGEGPLDVFTMPAIILVTGMELSSIIFAMVYARMHEISGSLVAAARMSGATAIRSFWTVTLPLLRPALVAGVVVAFLIGLGSFTAPLLLGRRQGISVITTEVFRLREQFPIDYALAAALGLPLLVIGVISIGVQRAVVGDQRRYVTQGSGRGMDEKASTWAFVSVIAYGVVTVVLPIGALVVVAFSPFWSGDLSSITFSTKNFGTTFNNPAVSNSIFNSLLTSALAMLVVLPLGFITALAMSGVLKAPKPVQYILDYVFIAPLAVPRAMLGMVVLFVFIRPPFSLYGTLTLFVIGYAFIVLPFCLRSQYASLIGVHSSLFEAARVTGASQFRTVLSVALPLTRRGITASLAIGFILLSHDFAVAVMLRSPGNQVMGTLLYELGETGVFPEVAVMALVMTTVTAAILALTLWVGGRKALENL
jgi:iron(III) transport system permease protein